ISDFTASAAQPEYSGGIARLAPSGMRETSSSRSMTIVSACMTRLLRYPQAHLGLPMPPAQAAADVVKYVAYLASAASYAGRGTQHVLTSISRRAGRRSSPS